MKRLLSAAALMTWTCTLPALAQEIAPAEPAPSVFEEYLSTHAPAGEVVDLVRAWPVDADGRAPTDYLVQSAYASAGGGNAYWLRHFIFVARPDGAFQPVEIPEMTSGIKAVRQQPGGLALVLYEYLDGDARCCPTGTSEVLLDLGQF